MQTSHCSFRRFAALLSAAAVCLFGTGPAAAAETAYLMYVRGSEGPPATPLRVLWDEIDHANAHITIDLGVKYEGFLGKLGLGRVLSYDARLEKAQWFVRNPDLTRFVKIVATSIIQGLAPAKPVPGAEGQPAEALVQDAALAIIRAPDKTRLEVITRLHVTYLLPRKSGPPIAKELVRGDLVFVGAPEPAPSR